MKQTIEGRLFEIQSGKLGNGLTFWNKAEQENGDFKTIAHVSNEGKLSFRSELPQEVREPIEREAGKMRVLFETKQINALKMQRSEAEPGSEKYKLLQDLIKEGEKQLREKREKLGI